MSNFDAHFEAHMNKQAAIKGRYNRFTVIAMVGLAAVSAAYFFGLV